MQEYVARRRPSRTQRTDRLYQGTVGFLQSRANEQSNCFEVTEIKQPLTENPPQCIFCSLMAFPQNRGFPGFDIRLCLKNDWFIAQSQLRAPLVEKLEEVWDTSLPFPMHDT